jgi:predicted ferric reductase
MVYLPQAAFFRKIRLQFICQGGLLMKARPVKMYILALLVITTIFWVTTISFGPFDQLYLRHFGMLFAALGLVLIFLQFLLATRVRFIEAEIGLDRLLHWHRFCGRAGLTALVLHVSLIAYYRITVFGDLFPTTFIWVGLVALIGFMVTAALASTHRILGIAYETWRGIHLVNYLLFPFVLIHVFYHTTAGSLLYYLWLLLAALYAALIFYRLVRIAVIRNNPYEVVAVRQEAADIWSLDFKGKTLKFNPGQFMFIQLKRNGRLSSAHPFTISNSPTREYLSITPKKLGDFTATIKDTTVGDSAYIDAPYGVFSFVKHDYSEMVFIAGGIGITPFISMLRFMQDLKLDQKVTLFWVNRTEKQLCFRRELEELQQELPCFKVVLVMTDQADWQGEKGHLSAQMLSDSLDNLDNKGFFVCGPAAMSRAAIAELKAAGVQQSRIHSELFAL